MKTNHLHTVKRCVATALLGLGLLIATALPSLAQTAAGNQSQPQAVQTVPPGMVYPGWGCAYPYGWGGGAAPAPGYGGWGCW